MKVALRREALHGRVSGRREQDRVPGLPQPPAVQRTGSNIDGEIIAFHAIGGRIKWRRTIGPSETSPLVSNGLVYAGDWNGKIYAFDTATGRRAGRSRPAAR
jgi:outer membrane protein assembly factor BamB